MNAGILKVCIETLNQVCVEKRGTLEAEVIDEIRKVVVELEGLLETSDEDGKVAVPKVSWLRTLEVIGAIFESANHLSEIIKSFLDGQ